MPSLPVQSPQAMPEPPNQHQQDLDADIQAIRSRVRSFEAALDDYLSSHAPPRQRLKLLIRSLQTAGPDTAELLLSRIDELIDMGNWE